MERVFEDARDKVQAKYGLCGARVFIEHHEAHHYVWMRVEWNLNEWWAAFDWTCSLHADADWPRMLDEILRLIVDGGQRGATRYGQLVRKFVCEHYKALRNYHDRSTPHG